MNNRMALDRAEVLDHAVKWVTCRTCKAEPGQECEPPGAVRLVHRPRWTGAVIDLDRLSRAAKAVSREHGREVEAEASAIGVKGGTTIVSTATGEILFSVPGTPP